MQLNKEHRGKLNRQNRNKMGEDRQRKLTAKHQQFSNWIKQLIGLEWNSFEWSEQYQKKTANDDKVFLTFFLLLKIWFRDLALRVVQYLVYLFSADFSRSLYFFRTCFHFVFCFHLFWFFFSTVTNDMTSVIRLYNRFLSKLVFLKTLEIWILRSVWNLVFLCSVEFCFPPFFFFSPVFISWWRMT